MAGGIDWFRWYHGSVNDPKFGLVAKKEGASVAEVIAVWACLLEQASASEDRGNPGSIDFDAIDFALGMDEGKARRVYERMRERGLVDPETARIAAWEKRQPRRERQDDNSTERVRAFRERKRQTGECNGNETPCNATERSETPRGEESREEEKSVVRASPRGSRLPHDELPKDWRDWALSERPDLDPDSVFARFADYWRAQPGAKGRKSDWLATWRNWVRDQRAMPRVVASQDAKPWAGAI